MKRLIFLWSILLLASTQILASDGHEEDELRSLIYKLKQECPPEIIGHILTFVTLDIPRFSGIPSSSGYEEELSCLRAGQEPYRFILLKFGTRFYRPWIVNRNIGERKGKVFGLYYNTDLYKTIKAESLLVPLSDGKYEFKITHDLYIYAYMGKEFYKDFKRLEPTICSSRISGAIWLPESFLVDDEKEILSMNQDDKTDLISHMRLKLEEKFPNLSFIFPQIKKPHFFFVQNTVDRVGTHRTYGIPDEFYHKLIFFSFMKSYKNYTSATYYKFSNSCV